MNRPGLVVFDMIGTTVQASDKIPETFATAFGEEGIRLSRGDVNSVRGKSKRDAIRELLTKSGGEGLAASRSEGVYAAFKSVLLEYYRDEPVDAIDGAEETFRWCHRLDIKVALTTGFDRGRPANRFRLGHRRKIPGIE